MGPHDSGGGRVPDVLGSRGTDVMGVLELGRGLTSDDGELTVSVRGGVQSCAFSCHCQALDMQSDPNLSLTSVF